MLTVDFEDVVRIFLFLYLWSISLLEKLVDRAVVVRVADVRHELRLEHEALVAIVALALLVRQQLAVSHSRHQSTSLSSLHLLLLLLLLLLALVQFGVSFQMAGSREPRVTHLTLLEMKKKTLFQISIFPSFI